MADDPLTAALEEIKRDHRQHVSVNFPVPGVCVSNRDRWPCQAYRAASAVDAALKLHRAEPWYCAASDCEHPEPPDDSDDHDDWYDDHTSGTGGIVVCLLTQVDSICPECTRLKYDTLEPEGDDFVSAPCDTRSAILAALTGEGGRP